MMKSKNKKQADEGSTQSNASRYDLFFFFSAFLPFFLLSVLIVYFVKLG